LEARLTAIRSPLPVGIAGARPPISPERIPLTSRSLSSLGDTLATGRKAFFPSSFRSGKFEVEWAVETRHLRFALSVAGPICRPPAIPGSGRPLPRAPGCTIIPQVLNTQAFRDVLTETLKKAPLEHVPLERVSSFGVGGPADLFFEAGEEDDLVRAAALASREGFPYYVIGGGSNLLFDDSGYRGLIIRNRIEGVDVLPNRLAARSGTALSALVREALGHGLRGLEFLAGIPGTVGGALFGNAGAFGRSLGEAFEEAALLESGGERLTVGRADLTFGYRRSSLQEKHALILGATFSVTPGDPRASEAEIREYLDRRRAKHPPCGTLCAGSYFKNPVGRDGVRVPAGRLLEEAGAKGMSIGGAAVYEGHCNFIVNKGNARSDDIRNLAAALRELVLGKTGVLLEEEVIYLAPTVSMP
jgi:UDP-N-acetylmuramate dehydrogenase